MADLSRKCDPRWVWFAAGAVAALALVLGGLAWRAGLSGVQVLLAPRVLPSLRDLAPREVPPPHLPDAPAPR